MIGRDKNKQLENFSQRDNVTVLLNGSKKMKRTGMPSLNPVAVQENEQLHEKIRQQKLQQTRSSLDKHVDIVEYLRKIGAGVKVRSLMKTNEMIL